MKKWKVIIRHEGGSVDEIGIFDTRQETIEKGQIALGLTNGSPFWDIPENKNHLELKICKKFNADYSDLSPVEYKIERLEFFEIEV